MEGFSHLITPVTVKVLAICATLLAVLAVFVAGARRKWFKTFSLGVGKAGVSLKTAGEANDGIYGYNFVLKRLDDIEEGLALEKEARDNFNLQTKERLASITKNIDEVREQINEIILKSLKAIIHTATSEPIERMQALKEYLSRGGDGNTVDFAINNFLMANPKLWYSLFGRAEDLSKVKYPRHYEKETEYIKKCMRVVEGEA